MERTWIKNVNDRSTPDDVDSISDTIEDIMENLYELRGIGGFSFKDVDLTKFNSIHLAAALRATSSWKGQIPDWEQRLAACKLGLQMDGYNVADTLYGLIPKE